MWQYVASMLLVYHQYVTSILPSGWRVVGCALAIDCLSVAFFGGAIAASCCVIWPVFDNQLGCLYGDIKVA